MWHRGPLCGAAPAPAPAWPALGSPGSHGAHAPSCTALPAGRSCSVCIRLLGAPGGGVGGGDSGEKACGRFGGAGLPASRPPSLSAYRTRCTLHPSSHWSLARQVSHFHFADEETAAQREGTSLKSLTAQREEPESHPVSSSDYRAIPVEAEKGDPCPGPTAPPTRLTAASEAASAVAMPRAPAGLGPRSS